MNKLIRSKMCELFEKNNIEYKVSDLNNNDSFLLSLKEKLVEESNEVLQTSNNNELIEELSDVVEIVLTIMRMKKISKRKVKKILSKKIKGDFWTRRLFCEYVEIDNSNPAISYYLNNKQYIEK
jgi:predicted house-cleaning noncanonical NTP pyrophosphatase (MazG superfamily)